MIWIFVVFLVMAASGIPIAIAMGIAAVFALHLVGAPAVSVAQKMVTGTENILYLAIPFFVLAGQLMNTSKITSKIFDFANVVVGKIPGGLGHVNILSSVIFAGMSGSAVADAGGLGAIEMQAMRDAGFDDDFSGAITAASAVIGPIIPPSIPMVIYGGIAEVSIGALFLGGVIPGICMAIALATTVFIYAKKRGYPTRPTMTWQQIQKVCVDAIIPLMAPAIILGGILSGKFTPTEAAAVAAFYALFVDKIFYKQLNLKALKTVFIETVETTCNILFIISCSAAFSYALNRIGLANILSTAVFSVTTDPLLVVIGINVLLFFLGMVMDAGALIILLTPILIPMLKPLGVDLQWFGVVMVVNLMMGTITPPVGVSLYTVCKVANIPIEKLSVKVLPFIIPETVIIILCIVFPALVTWLPTIMQ
jgi:tripartite ATP-independent transporter DctM subunit